MILLQQPFDYKIQHHIIDDKFIDKLYIKLVYNPVPNTIKIKIEKINSVIYGYQYEIIKVNNSNSSRFDDCHIDQYVITFDSTYNSNCEKGDSLFDNSKLGLIMVIQYIHQDFTVEEIIEDNYDSNIDSTDWSN